MSYRIVLQEVSQADVMGMCQMSSNVLLTFPASEEKHLQDSVYSNYEAMEQKFQEIKCNNSNDSEMGLAPQFSYQWEMQLEIFALGSKDFYI